MQTPSIPPHTPAGRGAGRPAAAESHPVESGRGASDAGRTAAARAAAQPASAPDRVTVSAEARLRARIEAAAQAAPGERAALVEALRAEVDAGTYTVDAAALARTLLDRGAL